MMKILNRAKTHFMQKSEHGTHQVKFGKVKDVQASIDDILDGENHQNKVDANNLTSNKQVMKKPDINKPRSGKLRNIVKTPESQ